MIIGGVTPTGTSNSVLVYDSQNGFILKEGPSMMNARAFFACSTMVAGLSLLSPVDMDLQILQRSLITPNQEVLGS